MDDVDAQWLGKIDSLRLFVRMASSNRNNENNDKAERLEAASGEEQYGWGVEGRVVLIML